MNSLNPYILRGNPAAGVGLVYDTLMTGSLDERDALYGLVAKKVRISADKLTYTFLLRKEARFHDGSPLTAHDVAFSLNILKTEGHPIISQSLRDLVSATALADDVLVVKLAPGRARDLPIIVASQPIFSKAYYTKHKFNETTLEPPLGSCAYKVGPIDPGRYISFQRVPDYWAKDLPVNVGQANFEVIRFDYFGDRNVAFEAFKAGAFTVHEEFTSAIWATGYDFPAFRDGRVKREEIPDTTSPAPRAGSSTLRRTVFKDPRVREALGYAFDFEWTNRNLMYDAYKRTSSYFENSDLEGGRRSDAGRAGAARAVPRPLAGGRIRRAVPAAGVGRLGTGSHSAAQGHRSARPRPAARARTACCACPTASRWNSNSSTISSMFERHTQPFIKNLKLLGVNARMRVVDAAQYQAAPRRFRLSTSSRSACASPIRRARSCASFRLEGGAHQGLAQSGRHRRSGRRRADRQGAGRQVARGARRHLPRARPRADRRPLLDSALVQADALDRPLGRVRPPGALSALRPGIASTWWWDEEKARKINYAGR